MSATEFELNWFGSWVLLVGGSWVLLVGGSWVLLVGGSWVLLVGGSWMVLLVCFRGGEVSMGPLIPVP